MTEFTAGVLMGSFVIVVAAIFVAFHYRREHRRQQIFKNMEKGHGP